jgi:uncharacterized damage-inducible protein DinB
MSVASVSSSPVIPSDALRQHWQGHRRLTRRVIDVFPEDQLFTFTLGGMRPFGVMVAELLSIGAPMMRGIVTGEWAKIAPADAAGGLKKADLLQQWDADTATIEELWPKLTPERFSETMTAFGQYPGKVYDLLLYGIDNEIHHRAQGYVYLRALGIAPPPFYERD